MNDNNAPHYTELPIAQLEWDTAQLDDWGIDLPDFTDEQEEAMSLQESSHYRADFVAHTSSKSNSPFGTF